MQHELHDIPPRLLESLRNTPVVEERTIDGIVASGWRVGNRKPLREVPTDIVLRVLTCASYGLTDSMVANVMGLSENTVKTHVRAAIALLKAKNKLHAVAICLREGYIH